jgi:outer membrane protein OmpA-like peptidoglycan-associated protein
MKQLFRFFLLIFCFLTLHSFAQDEARKIGVQVGGGVNQLFSDLGDGFFDFSRAPYGFAQVGLSYYLNRSFDANFGVSYGEVGFWTESPNILDLRGRMAQGVLSVKYKFANGYILNDKSKIRPYIYLGAGGANFAGVPGEDSTRVNAQTAYSANGGVGLTFMLTDRLSLGYNLGYLWLNSDNIDRITTKSNEQILQHSLNLGYTFGAPKDDDKDGIPNLVDKCPDTPAGIKTDLLGCPIDSDLDGIADYLDSCISEKGIAQFNGCPDTDGDGIKDSEDSCPQERGLANFRGCPDSDGDGIKDSEDSCPTVSGLAKFAGCPDTDGDGIIDKDDACPNIKGLANFQGCPDTDGDGIKDGDDTCPTVAGVAANKGCPEVKEEVKQLFSKALTGIQFETGKDIIKKNSFPILDQVVKVMMENPEYKLDIFGHTDNQGDSNKNLDLSERRAKAVEKYLIEKGVPQSRIVAVKGFGSTMPVADNSTAEGRAKNRRVEFKVEF